MKKGSSAYLVDLTKNDPKEILVSGTITDINGHFCTVNTIAGSVIEFVPVGVLLTKKQAYSIIDNRREALNKSLRILLEV